MDNNVDKLIKFCKEHKGDVFDVYVYNKLLPCTLVGYNHRNGNAIVRLPKGSALGWSGMVLDDGEDILLWKRYKAANYNHYYVWQFQLEKKYERTNQFLL